MEVIQTHTFNIHMHIRTFGSCVLTLIDCNSCPQHTVFCMQMHTARGSIYSMLEIKNKKGFRTDHTFDISFIERNWMVCWEKSKQNGKDRKHKEKGRNRKNSNRMNDWYIYTRQIKGAVLGYIYLYTHTHAIYILYISYLPRNFCTILKMEQKVWKKV